MALYGEDVKMKWFALLGLILFLGVAVAPSITADVKEQGILESAIKEDNQFEKLIGLIERITLKYTLKKEFECGCERNFPEEYNFPIICRLLYPVYIVSICLESRFHINLPYNGLIWIAWKLNCDWW